VKRSESHLDPDSHADPDGPGPLSEPAASERHEPSDGRIGTVAAAVLARELGGAAESVWDWAGRIVHERLWVGEGPPSSLLRAQPRAQQVDAQGNPFAILLRILEASAAPGVLVIGAGLEIEGALALLAWPEADIVLPEPSARPAAALCGLYRSERVVRVGRELAAASEPSLEALYPRLDVAVASFPR